MTPRELAAEHAARRRARLARIRTTVAAVSASFFILLFSGIYVQMAAGRDPALGSKASATTKAKSSSSPSTSSSASDTSTSGTSTWDSSSWDTGSSDTGSSDTGSQPSAVTTSQS
jgi:hypothetical protein